MNNEISVAEITGIVVNSVKLENRYMITIEDIFRTIQVLNNKIDKAIEYINEELSENGSHCVSGSDLPYDVIENLLKILQGSDSQ